MKSGEFMIGFDGSQLWQLLTRNSVAMEFPRKEKLLIEEGKKTRREEEKKGCDHHKVGCHTWCLLLIRLAKAWFVPSSTNH